MTEDEETIARTIAEASVLPLKDAAYLLWRELLDARPARVAGDAAPCP
jgi:hypothetical protein